ncbi:MAG: hypothetical protein R3185_06785, partial [Candidatus Thermoplasmatota archaeon]|nr:hypothetical protein [Candidatus Thermoplasmatota archaeon]
MRAGVIVLTFLFLSIGLAPTAVSDGLGEDLTEREIPWLKITDSPTEGLTAEIFHAPPDQGFQVVQHDGEDRSRACHGLAPLVTKCEARLFPPSHSFSHGIVLPICTPGYPYRSE